jgi:hypothetical protein
MAQSQQPERDGEAEFVRRIVTDPNNVPDVMRLYGYLGASSEEHHDRLYLDPDLSSYVEVPRSAILHRMAVPTEQDPNGAVVLWVRQDAALIQKAAPTTQALAQYFAGAIAGAAAAGPVPDPWRWANPPAALAGLLTVHPPPFCPPPTLLCTKVGCPATYVLSACCHPSYVPCTPECQFAAAAPAGAAPAAAAAQLAATYQIYCRPTRVDPWCPYPTEICTAVPAVCHTRPPFCFIPEAAAGAAPEAVAAQLPLTQVNIYCQTRDQPWCPYPTEVCTIAGPGCQTRHPPICGLPAAAAGARAMPAVAFGGTLPQVQCTALGCPPPSAHAACRTGHPFGCYISVVYCPQ